MAAMSILAGHTATARQIARQRLHGFALKQSPIVTAGRRSRWEPARIALPYALQRVPPSQQVIDWHKAGRALD
jgi:hypothetical protein